MGAILVMYHYIRDGDHPARPGTPACSVADFEGQLEYLLRHYEPLEPDALLAAVRDRTPIPDGFVLTFDDGTRDHWDNALPVLERHGLHGIFAPIGLPYIEGKVPFVQKNQFVRGRLGEDGLPDAYIAIASEIAPEVDLGKIIRKAPIGEYRRGTKKYLRFKYASNKLIPFDVSLRVMNRLFAEHVTTDEESFVHELYMSREELVELRRRGHAIAGHSINHPSLPCLDEAAQEREVRETMAWVSDLIGEPLAWFNYPYGDHDERSQRVCERLGLEIAYGIRPPIDWVSHEDRFRAPRVDTYHLPVDPAAEPVRLHGEIV